MDKGIYCLVFKNPACTLTIGALGLVAFEAGWHIYVGSALGSGGLVRLERHIALSRNRDRCPKWHVDYLSLSPFFSLRSAVFALTDMENIPGFGASDCNCRSHLFYRRRNPVQEIEAAFRSLGLAACTKTLMNRERSKG
jgi:Uri superfamily endonuclease